MTDADMRGQVVRVLNDSWGNYDIPAIVEDIQQEYGLLDLDDVLPERFWDIVEQHETV